MELHVEAAGRGSAVVLLHAGVCDSRMWDPQWDAAAAAHQHDAAEAAADAATAAGGVWKSADAPLDRAHRTRVSAKVTRLANATSVDARPPDPFSAATSSCAGSSARTVRWRWPNPSR